MFHRYSIEFDEYEAYLDVQTYAECLVTNVVQDAVLISLRNCARTIVEDILEEALDRVTGKYIEDPKSKYQRYTNVKYLPCDITSQEDEYYRNIKWPTNSEFSVEFGEQKIEEFINTWNRGEEWLYCIDFVFQSCDSCSNYYLYEVKWSIPTPAYPIPQAVASVFFTIEVSKIKPGIYPVQVTYAFEGHRFVHKPGETDFCEDFLQNIIDSKIKFIKQINF